MAEKQHENFSNKLENAILIEIEKDLDHLKSEVAHLKAELRELKAKVDKQPYSIFQSMETVIE